MTFEKGVGGRGTAFVRWRSLALGGALLIILAAVIGTTVAACGSSTNGASTTGGAGQTSASGQTGATGASGAVQVIMKNTTFVPAAVTIKVGQTVTWVNEDPLQHDVVANDGSFKSSILNKGGTFSFMFTKAGSFSYYCAIHPTMTGTVTVQP